MHLPWWGLALGFLAAERCVVHLHFRRSAHSFSLGDLPLVFGLLFATPDRPGGRRARRADRRAADRPPPAGRSSSSSTSRSSRSPTCLAVIVFHELASAADGFGPATVGGVALLATQLSAFVTVLLIGAAISLSEGRLGAKALGPDAR